MRWSPVSNRAICCVGAVAALLLATAVSTRGLAQEPEAERALKYHKLLVSRPEPGYLFDRFYNTWLDESTVDALEKFLASQAQQSRATPDQLLLAFFYVKKGDDVAALEQFRNDNTSIQHFNRTYPAEYRLALDVPTAISALPHPDAHNLMANVVAFLTRRSVSHYAYMGALACLIASVLLRRL